MAAMSRAPSPHSAGFTLIEVLVALALGALVTTTVIGLLLATNRHQTRHAAVANIQDTARVVFAILHHAIQQAGYDGCAGATHWQGLAADSLGFEPGLHETLQPVLPAPARHARQVRGDQLVLQTMSAKPPAIEIIGEYTMPAPHLPGLRLARPATHIARGEVVRLVGLDLGLCMTLRRSNAEDAALIERLAGEGQPANRPLGTEPAPQFSGTALVYAPEQTRFFVAESAVMPGHYSLFRQRRSEGDRAQELLEGVHDLRIEYLARSPNGSLISLRATDPALAALDATTIVGVRLHLLLYAVGVDRLPAPGRTELWFAEAPYPPPDGRLYQALSSTVALRNRRPRRRAVPHPPGAAPRGKPPAAAAPHRARGSALITVLAVMLAVALLAGSAARDALLQLRLASGQHAQVQALLSAEAALRLLEVALDTGGGEILVRAAAPLITVAQWRQALLADGHRLPAAGIGLTEPAISAADNGAAAPRVLIERLPPAQPLWSAPAEDALDDEAPPAVRYRLTVQIPTGPLGGGVIVQSVYRPATAASASSPATPGLRLGWKRIP